MTLLPRIPLLLAPVVFLLLFVGACGVPGPTPDVALPSDERERELRTAPFLDAELTAAATEFRVPMALLKAFAFAQSRYTMLEGAEELEGLSPAFGIMALRSPLLERAAALAGVTVDEAKQDRKANLRAGAALLSALADEPRIERTDLAAWLPVVGRATGFADPESQAEVARDDVFGALRAGVGVPLDGLLAETLPTFGTKRQALTVAPDFAKGFWYPSVEFSARTRAPTLVIIHTCEGAYAGCRDYLRNNDRQVSAHYVVGVDEVAQLVRETDKAHHIGATYDCVNNEQKFCNLNTVAGNELTIGIEHGGFAAQTTFPASQLERSAELLCDISRRRSIPIDRYHVVGHGQLQPYNRTDPGPNWPWTSYRARAQALCDVTLPPAGCTVEASGPIGLKYESLGGADGVLGPCTSGELPAADGKGRFHHFERGTVYWHPDSCAYAVVGEIHKSWEAAGGETSLGHPLSDVQTSVDGVGRYSHFSADASIYSHPSRGTFAITGPLRARWLALGAEQSRLGYPVSDLETENGVQQQRFERGALRLESDGKIVEVIDPDLTGGLPKEGPTVRLTREGGCQSVGGEPLVMLLALLWHLVPSTRRDNT